jgi:hypothetical protein
MKCCLSGVIPSIPVIADYFGNAETEIDLIIVLGIYKGLVKYKGVNLELLNNCFHSNRLDELVHARNKTEPNGDYLLFKARNLTLESMTSRLLPLPKEEHMPIYNDDQCPICGHEGFITEEREYGDCYKCFRMMCCDCFSHVNRDYEALCKNCSEEGIKGNGIKK